MHGRLQRAGRGSLLRSSRICRCRAKYAALAVRRTAVRRHLEGGLRRSSSVGFDGYQEGKALKRPQTWTGLKSTGDLDERGAMSPTLSPAMTRNDRRLVFTSSQAAEYLGVSLATIR